MSEIVREDQVFPKLDEVAPKGVIKVIRRIIMENNGSLREQYVWKRGAFVTVVAIDKTKFVLKREFKYGQMCEFLTFAGGAIKKNEALFAAAARELQEELGMKSENMVTLAGSLVNSPDKSTELHYIVLARDVEVILDLEKEVGDVVRIDFDDVANILYNSHSSVRLSIVLQRLALFEALRYLRFITV